MLCMPALVDAEIGCANERVSKTKLKPQKGGKLRFRSDDVNFGLYVRSMIKLRLSHWRRKKCFQLNKSQSSKQQKLDQSFTVFSINVI